MAERVYWIRQRIAAGGHDQFRGWFIRRIGVEGQLWPEAYYQDTYEREDGSKWTPTYHGPRTEE